MLIASDGLNLPRARHSRGECLRLKWRLRWWGLSVSLPDIGLASVSGRVTPPTHSNVRFTIAILDPCHHHQHHDSTWHPGELSNYLTTSAITTSLPNLLWYRAGLLTQFVQHTRSLAQQELRPGLARRHTDAPERMVLVDTSD